MKLNSIFILMMMFSLSIGFSSCTEDPPDDPDPTCTDGIQNQGETGVDCGGECDACLDPATGIVSCKVDANNWENIGTPTVTVDSDIRIEGVAANNARLIIKANGTTSSGLVANYECTYIPVPGQPAIYNAVQGESNNRLFLEAVTDDQVKGTFEFDVKYADQAGNVQTIEIRDGDFNLSF